MRETARKFGAEGIGLCRTEHMFFDAERIGAVREMILADDEGGRRAALAKLLPMQRSDFVELFRIMDGLPVTIRLLDPPLHEFLPQATRKWPRSPQALGTESRRCAARRASCRGQPDARPSRLPAGHRLSGDLRNAGARDLRGRDRGGQGAGDAPVPEIMIPLVGMRRELEIMRAQVDRVAAGVRRDGQPPSSTASAR